MKGVPFPSQIRELIIKRAREGDKIEDLAKEFKVYPNTIRKWLTVSGGVSGVNVVTGRNLRSNDLLMAKLNREKQELLVIIGELTLQLKKKL
jgi:transposase-like protein